MALNDTGIKNLKFTGKAIKHTDGQGLYLLVNQAGKYWRMDYAFAGKRKTLALGVYPAVSLAKARKRRDEAREQLAENIDPNITKKQARANLIAEHAATFEKVADIWLKKTASQRKAITEEKLVNWLRHDIYPIIGSIPVSLLTAPDVLRVLRKLEARGVSDTVRRIKQIISRVMAFAVSEGMTQGNPASHIQNRDSFERRKTKHHPAIIDPVSFGGLLRAIRGYTGSKTTHNALELSPLVFVRPGEMRLAEWSEFDLDKAVWEIPAQKMKMGIAHTVPLSRQAVTILRQQHAISGHGKHVFPSIRGQGRPMSENTVNAALRTLGFDGETHTHHGFRASARTMLDERLGLRVEHIEMQLAHKVKDANGNAYNRTSFWDARVKMMQVWADYLDLLRNGGQVIPLSKAA